MSSIAVAGYGFGSVIWIPLETAYVNPQNIDPIAVDENVTNSDKYKTFFKLFICIANLKKKLLDELW